jgi:hypothetical protein
VYPLAPTKINAHNAPDLKLLLPLRIEEEEVCRVEATTTDFTDEMACIVLEFRVVFSVEGEQRRY